MRIPLAMALVACTIGCASSRDITEEGETGIGSTAVALTEADTGSYQLYVTKNALTDGTEFLLSTSSVLTDIGEPAFNGMLSRVVTFKRADGKVHMLESQKGAAIDATLLKPNIIASFPVVSETDAAVGLDFNEGAKTFLLAFDWTASDDSPSNALFSTRFFGAPLVQRYVDEGNTDAKGRITIRQVAQADLQGAGLSSTLELRYFLQPYTPDASYAKLVSKQDFRWGGYFESSPSIIPGTGGFQRYLSRFDPKKPLVYAVSSNTPEEVKQAVKDGILYWNRVLGREWIQVIDAPAGVVAPNLDYNLVQWIPEKGATFAYADAQLDPLTGEVKNAQVYFPSGWFDSTAPFIADSYARRVHAVAEAAVGKKATSTSTTKSAPTTTRQGDAHGHAASKPLNSRIVGACDKVNSRALEAASKQMLKRGLSEADIKLAALDWVRSAVSHEVGHTLGLRHNFAGSLGTNIKPEEVNGLLTNYFVTGGEWPADKVPGSSVMEYPAFEDDVAIGAFIRLGHPALAQDKAAIDALYNDVPLQPGGPLFCTDSEAGMTLDCVPYDRGDDIVANLRWKIENDLQNVAAEYVYWLRAAKGAGSGDVFATTAAFIDAITAYGSRSQVATLLSSDSFSLVSDRKLGSPAVNGAEIHFDTLQRMGESVLAAGGYEPFFSLLPADFDARFQAQLKELLSQPWITSGTGEFGEPWSFSPDELEQIQAYAPRYLAEYKFTAAKSDIDVLSLKDPMPLGAQIIVIGPAGVESGLPSFQRQWEAPVLEDELVQLLVDRTKHYLTASSGTFRAKVAVGSVSELPAPTPGKPGKKGSGQGGGSGDDDEPKEPSEAAAETPVVIRSLKLPIFTYPTELRTLAPEMLAASQSADRIWARNERDLPGVALATKLDTAAGGAFNALQLDGSDPEAQRWILDNQDVLGAAGGGESEGSSASGSPIP